MIGQLALFRDSPSGQAAHACPQHILLGNRIITYELHRGRRRLTLRIDERGLRVGSPRSLALSEIEAFIRQHGTWVLEKLDAFANASRPRYLAVRDGTRLPVLGEEICVRVTSGNNRGYWQDEARELWLAARPNAELAPIARRALQRRALEIFHPRLERTAACIDQPAPALALSSARTRWGSCSRHSGIRLNWRLIHLPPPLIDYVIAHEVAHLVEMNHSPRFWRVVEGLCPGWQDAREALKQRGGSLPLL